MYFLQSTSSDICHMCCCTLLNLLWESSSATVNSSTTVWHPGTRANRRHALKTWLARGRTTLVLWGKVWEHWVTQGDDNATLQKGYECCFGVTSWMSVLFCSTQNNGRQKNCWIIHLFLFHFWYCGFDKMPREIKQLVFIWNHNPIRHSGITVITFKQDLTFAEILMQISIECQLFKRIRNHVLKEYVIHSNRKTTHLIMQQAQQTVEKLREMLIWVICVHLSVCLTWCKAFLQQLCVLALHQMITFTWSWPPGVYSWADVPLLNWFIQQHFRPVSHFCQRFMRFKQSSAASVIFPFLSTVCPLPDQSRAQLHSSGFGKRAKIQKTLVPAKMSLALFRQSDSDTGSNLVNGTGRRLRKVASTVLPPLHWLSAVAKAEILIHSHWRKSLKNNWIFHEAYK